MGAGGADTSGCSFTSATGAPIWVIGSYTQPVVSQLTTPTTATSSIRRLVRGACGDVFATGLTSGVAEWGGRSIEGSAEFVAHIEPDGVVDWFRSWTDGRTQVLGAAAMPAGGFAIAGELTGPVDFGDGPHTGEGADAFVATFEPSGAVRSFNQFGDDEGQWATDLATNEAGDVALAATGYGKLSLGTAEPTDPTWVFELDASGQGRTLVSGLADVQPSLALDSQGRLTVSGALSGPTDFGLGTIGDAVDESTQYLQPYLLSYEETGELRFSKAFHGGDLPQPLALPGGELVLAGDVRADGIDVGCGSTPAGTTAFVAGLDVDGNCQWSQPLRGTSSVLVTPDGSGGLVLAGNADGVVQDSRGALPGSGELYVERLGSDGTPLRGKHLGMVEAGHAVRFASAAADASSIWLAATFSGKLELEGVTLRAATDRTETFVARIAF